MECNRTPQENLEIRVDRLIDDEAMWWNWSEEFKRLHAADISNAKSDDGLILADCLMEFLEQKLREMFAIYLRNDDETGVDNEKISDILMYNNEIKYWTSELIDDLIEDIDTLMITQMPLNAIRRLRRYILGAVVIAVSVNWCSPNKPEGEIHHRVIEAGDFQKP